MGKNSAAPQPTPHSLSGGDSLKSAENASSQRGQFIAMALNMSWQLALAVLVPVIAGAELDKSAGTSHLYTFIGLAIAVLVSAVVMWRAMQTANNLPVPKLSAAQKRAIQKQYEEDDD